MPSEKPSALPPGVPPLTSLYLYIAGSCNLACSHCWISPEFKENPAGGKFLRLDHIRSAIRQARPLGLRSVKLTGGEPLLHPRFREILTLIRREKLPSPIETNGILIDEGMAEFLAQSKPKPFVSVSIDGSTAETHENLRGVAGSFAKSVHAVQHLVARGLRPQIICTLHRGNTAEIAEVVNMAGDLGCESVKFNLIQEVGRGKEFSRKFGLSIPQCLDLSRQVEEEIAPRTAMRVIFDIPMAFYPLKRFLRKNSGRCHVLNILGLLPGGDLSLCGIGTTVPEMVFGRIPDQPLRDIWTGSGKLKKIRKNIPENFKGICYNCIHRDLCMGSCVAYNYFRTGIVNSSYYFCEEADRLGLFPKSRKKMLEEQDEQQSVI